TQETGRSLSTRRRRPLIWRGWWAATTSSTTTTSEQGSSGSPVIDENGHVVAVNFAKLVGSDNFNFGIPLDQIRDFLK
ncbi:MAG: hypothetical protein IKD78_09965, partial [Bacteroidales bacterium]|nr:hypothetical protein [Bacteroidales bacterium]